MADIGKNPSLLNVPEDEGDREFAGDSPSVQGGKILTPGMPERPGSLPRPMAGDPASGGSPSYDKGSTISNTASRITGNASGMGNFGLPDNYDSNNETTPLDKFNVDGKDDFYVANNAAQNEPGGVTGRGYAYEAKSPLRNYVNAVIKEYLKDIVESNGVGGGGGNFAAGNIRGSLSGTIAPEQDEEEVIEISKPFNKKVNNDLVKK